MEYRKYSAPVVTLICYSVLVGLFNITIAGSNSAEGTWPVFVVKYENKQYHVVHLTYGGAVTNITAKYGGIDVTLQSEHDGEVQLAIQKELLNATDISYDSNGHVPGIFVDGIKSDNYNATTREMDIVFEIPFKAGAEQIEIIGSDIPEFGTLVPAILGIAFATVILVSTRYRGQLAF